MSWLYDVYDAPMERLGTRRRRARLLAEASGKVLEVGVGTGKNLELTPRHRADREERTTENGWRAGVQT